MSGSKNNYSFSPKKVKSLKRRRRNYKKEGISEPYRLLVPFVNEIQTRAMDDEQDVDNDKEMVWIPEGIEAC